MKLADHSINPLTQGARSRRESATAERERSGYADFGAGLVRLRTYLAQVFERLGVMQRPLLACLTAVAIHFGIQLLTPAIFTDGKGDTVYWPVDGVLTAVMLILPRVYWPWLLLGSLVSQAAAMRGAPYPVLFADSVGNLVEPLIAAYSLPRFRGLSDWMEQPRLSLRFICGAVLLAPCVAASIYGLVFAAVYHQSFLWAASKWVRADLLGMTLALPLVLVLCSGETYKLFHPRAIGRTALVLVPLAVLSWAMFRWNSHPIAFTILPFLVLTVFELGFSGAVIGVNLVTLIVSSATVGGYGPFSVSSGPQAYPIPTLQLFLTMAMLISFPVGIVLEERKRFEHQLKEALKEMESLASNDALTGIPNRRHFDQAIEKEGRRALRTGQPLSLLMIDVDLFKTYNDCYGHVAGDDCLRRVAAAISSVPSRGEDLVSRYGGEEFAVLLPNSSLSTAVTVASCIAEAIAELRIEHKGSPHRVVTTSIGCGVAYPKAGWRATELIEAADRALYTAKHRGRNCVETRFTEGLAQAEESIDISFVPDRR